MKRSALGLAAWVIGAGLTAAGPGAVVAGTRAVALALLGLAAVAGLAVGVTRRKPGAFDVALAATAGAVLVRAPVLVGLPSQAWFVAGCALVALGHCLVRAAARSPQAPLVGIGRSAIAPVLGAALLAIALPRAGTWSASLVSPRWADSLDSGSVELAAVAGLVATALGAAWTLGRLALRRRPSDPDP